jgi:hypothetical protein
MVPLGTQAYISSSEDRAGVRAHPALHKVSVVIAAATRQKAMNHDRKGARRTAVDVVLNLLPSVLN